jgi:hypothetical protein
MKKKNYKIKKKRGGGGEGNQGVAPATPFLAKGWLEPPPRLIWGWSNHPHGQRGGSATPKCPKKTKKKREGNRGVAWPRGGSGHPIFGQGVAGATPTADLGVVEPPPWPRGWSSHPQKPKKTKKGSCASSENGSCYKMVFAGYLLGSGVTVRGG